jgi:autophagy-related protein 9
MTDVLAQVHYLPDSWVGKAHTQHVRNQFSQIFLFKAVSFYIILV